MFFAFLRKMGDAVWPLFVLGLCVIVCGSALAANEVRFTLTFADRPLPDLRSFTALRAGGSAVHFEVDNYLPGTISSWFMRAIEHHRLPMKYTYSGYVQRQSWLEWSKIQGPRSVDELSTKATELCLSLQEEDR